MFQPQKNMSLLPNLLMITAAAIGFGLSFRVNQLLDAYTLFSPGISLLFLPAGVKLLFVLIGRFPALVGLTAMAAYAAAIDDWPGRPLWSPISFAVIAHANYYVAIYAVMHLLKIRRDLVNLRYWHIVALSLAASATNGIIHNFVYLIQGVTRPEDLWMKAAAMAFGDFMGCFVVVALFQLAVSRLRLKAALD